MVNKTLFSPIAMIAHCPALTAGIEHLAAEGMDMSDGEDADGEDETEVSQGGRKGAREGGAEGARAGGQGE